jgi:hypothetical protein
LRKKKGEAASDVFDAHAAPVMAPTLDKHDKLFQIH